VPASYSLSFAYAFTAQLARSTHSEDVPGVILSFVASGNCARLGNSWMQQNKQRLVRGYSSVQIDLLHHTQLPAVSDVYCVSSSIKCINGRSMCQGKFQSARTVSVVGHATFV